MDPFDALVEIATILNGPEGCPWDKEQTFATLQPYLLEESHEFLEAVDEEDPGKMLEELGDLFYILLFYCILAEKKELFTLQEVLQAARSKLIRRHPHVFGNAKAETATEVLKQWEEIKSSEAAQQKRKSLLDGIPPSLPLLAKAQKILRKVKKSTFTSSSPVPSEFGQELFTLIAQAEEKGIDAEGALRRFLSHYEKSFRKWEEKT